MSSRSRRASATPARAPFVARLARVVVALALSSFSIPLLTQPSYADGAAPVAATETAAPATSSDPVVTADPSASQPADPAAQEPAPDPAPVPVVEESASTQPVAEAPVSEAPAVEAPVVEAPTAAAPTTKGSAPKPSSVAKVTTLAALPAPDCSVVDFDQNTQENSGGSWINGALNQVNSNYAEGDFVPQKVELDGLTPGTYTLGFTFDRTKSGKYAYDYVADLAIEGSSGASISWSSPQADFDGPAPTGFATAVPVTIEFTITSTTDATATLKWSGHIASELNYGPDSGAGSISGAPYHFSLISTNGTFGCDAGKRDNQLMADAVDFATVTVVKDAIPNTDTPFGFNITAPNNLAVGFNLVDDGTATNTTHYNVPPGSTSIAETLNADWPLQSIVCTGSTSGTVTGNSVALTLADNDTVTCTFTNSRSSALVVDKYWVINGGNPVQEGSEPSHLGLGAQLHINSADKDWGTSYTGYLQGATTNLDETVSFGNTLCNWASSDPTAHGRITEANTHAVDFPVPHDVVLGGGDNHYTITNTVTCAGELTLAKHVDNGDALASAWTLSATPTGSGMAFASGHTGVTHNVTADSAYALSEDDADSRYVQVGPWSCTQYGTVTAGAVTVEAGRSATCTVTNATSELILQKFVQNPNGGHAVPGDFTLIANPAGSGANLTTAGSEAGHSFFVNPGEIFALSESGSAATAGYTLAGINCGNGDVTSVQVPVGTTVTCAYTNIDSPGLLSLDKTVVSQSGDGATAANWHLSATPINIAGQLVIEGDGTASGATKAGTYQLHETGRSGYAAGSWTCVDDTTHLAVPVSASDQVTVGANEEVSCGITNTAIPPTLTLVKDVHHGTTGDETTASAFTLTATPNSIAGQTPVAGAGGAHATVKVGTYTLSETGPATYAEDPAGWTCLNGQTNVPVTNGHVTVGLNMDVICTIINTAIPSSYMLEKSSDPASGATVMPGSTIDYTVTATKVGDGVPVEDFNVTDTLTGIQDSWVTGLDAGATITNGVITWHIDELGNTPLTLTYTVTVGSNDWNAVIGNQVTPGPTPCVNQVTPAGTIDCDHTEHFTPHYTLDKAVQLLATPGNDDGLAEPGERLQYSLTVHNDTAHAVLSTTVTDDLTDVLINASMVTTDAALAAEGVSLSGNALTWTITNLAPGASLTVTYVVQIHDDAFGVTLHNIATPKPDSGGECIPAGDVPSSGPTAPADDTTQCETTTETPVAPTLTLVKDVRHGTTGDETTASAFTLNATPNQATADKGQLVLTGPGGASDTVLIGTYTLSESGPTTYAEDPAGWDCNSLKGEVTSDVPVNADSQITIGYDTNVTCTIINRAIPSSYMLEKSSDPASGATVMPGSTIDYTVTASKVGNGVPVEDFNVTDTLTGIQDSWVTGLDAGATITNGVITWHIDELGSAPLTLTYTVTVGLDDWDAVVGNQVTPGPTPCVDQETSTGVIDCDHTEHFTPHYTLDKAVRLLAAPGDNDGLAEPGERLQYSLTVHNDTDNAVLSTTVTDDLTNVLSNASMVTTDAALAADGLALGTDNVLVWTIDNLAPGASLTVTYVVQINDHAWGVTLHNIATPAPLSGGECIPAGDVPSSGPQAPPDNTDECQTTTDTPQVTTMVVEKRDVETDEVLAGATFQLFLDANNAVNEAGDCTFATPPVIEAVDQSLGTSVTGADGQSLFNELQHGCYLLQETAPPAGYSLPANAVMGIQVDESNFVGGDKMSPIVVTDFGEGNLAIVAKRQFEKVGNDWVLSDGKVGFGDHVRYEVKVQATGPKNFHNVLATDYVPGYNPADTISTVKATLVPGSAACVDGLVCTVTVDPVTQLVTWNIGDLEPDPGVTIGGTATMEVVFPDRPANLQLAPGESYNATLWNVGFLEWDEVTAPTTPAARIAHAAGRAGLFSSAATAVLPLTHIKLTSNEVVVSALFKPPAGKTHHHHTPPPPGGLPQTGAPAGLAQLAVLGLSLIAGGLILTRRTRKG